MEMCLGVVLVCDLDACVIVCFGVNLGDMILMPFHLIACYR